ncbi:MAG: thiamine-phosphate kinase, partial [Candidatus Aminicenantes bacterium]|nr:thiamine-phosphate kinase [Candidatus Aminicenantes bacterium]
RIHRLLEEQGFSSARILTGIGDDTASILNRSGYELLITCDCLVENRHYLSGRIYPFDLGRRAMTVNISDIGAMGGQPCFALVSLGLKPELPVDFIDEMYKGFLAELNPFQASIIGGNITKVQDNTFIDITLIGEVEKGRSVHRSTAQPGDLILVTGFPGQAAAGLNILLHSSFSEELNDLPLVKAFNTPGHRAREGRAVALKQLATAMIDTSDGFFGDLFHICEESQVGAVLIKDKIPIGRDLRDFCLTHNKNPYDMFFQDSDDYELIMTCRPEHLNSIREVLSNISDVSLAEIGRITENRNEIYLVEPDGREIKLKTKGWDHFAKE